ncbi:MAG TPA: histidine phosphatase family protein [Nevskiaceae bacterium]|nr:histidine phosphatase family protein [Nevskiaceae bacterium]
MTTLVLVRHGQASFGAASYDALSENGRRQSFVLGEHWKRTGFDMDGLYCGDMVRQKTTGLHALEAMQRSSAVTTHSAFNEYDFDGILRGYLPVVAREEPAISIERKELYANPRAFQLVFEKAIALWLSGREPDGGIALEGWSRFRARVLAGLREVAAPGRKQVVVFTSGGVIAVALQQALGLTDEMTFRMNWRIYNASVHTFRVGRSGLSLTGFNNITPLELAGDAALLTFR